MQTEALVRPALERAGSDSTVGVHFISGLPRSGSTLLSAILRQNPRFSAGVSSPLAGLCSLIHQRISQGEFSVFFDVARREAMLRSLFHSYYSRLPRGQVVFDTNRSWTGRMPLLAQLFPRSRVICCVREVGWILDSLERLRAKNPLHHPKVLNPQPESTVYTRVEALMHPKTGLVGRALSSLREAWFADEAERLVVVPYNSIVRRPHATLARLYEALGEEPFEHDFENVQYEEAAYDEGLEMPGLHTVRPMVRQEERTARIPPDLFAKYANTDFWARGGSNVRNVTVL